MEELAIGGGPQSKSTPYTSTNRYGVAEGDEVITTPMTDIGTVAAILAAEGLTISTGMSPANNILPQLSGHNHGTRDDLS